MLNTCPLSANRDSAWIATKCSNVVLYPAESKLLVSDTQVAGPGTTTIIQVAWKVMREKSPKEFPIGSIKVDDYHSY